MNTGDKVRCILAEADLSTISIEAVARQMGYSQSSSLNRRLRLDSDTNWVTLLANERRRRAINVLRANPRACMGRLMQRCGLGRQRMSNSIRLWFGCTLREIRNNPEILERKRA